MSQKVFRLTKDRYRAFRMYNAILNYEPIHRSQMPQRSQQKRDQSANDTSSGFHLHCRVYRKKGGSADQCE